ncbi:MAG: hypothetical protein JSV89_18065 [Spirochaetaceae bacterium]|nr:MAG: hypothetical protein JSV89_18065 [Spirochaetaceae bacterium]
MKTIEVGAFEAKTYFSRRGKPVAVLKQDEAISRESSLNALRELRTLCKVRITLDEIEKLRDKGRER